MTCATHIDASARRSSASADKVFAYATFDRAADYLRLGWIPHPALEGTRHGEWSVLMEWLCQCPVPKPKKRP